MQVDENVLLVLEYAMPLPGGLGRGIDRRVTDLTGLGICDTVLFALVRAHG